MTETKLKKENDSDLSQIARLWLLFSTFFKIALFVVGGGLAMLPVIESVFVKRKLLTEKDTLDMVVLTQTVPGLVAANSAIFVGTKIAGFFGAVVALIGAILPSLIIITIIAALFPDLDTKNSLIQGGFTGIRSGITAVLSVTLFKLIKKIICRTFDAVFVSVALLLLLINVNPVWIIVGSMPIGCIYFLWEQRRQKQHLSELKGKS